MVRKPSNPALYELIHARAAAHHAKPKGRDDPPEASPEEMGRWLSPGRTVRFPIGYLFIAGALIGGLVIGTYIFGYRRGEQTAGAGYEESLLTLARRSEEMRTRDPLVVPGRVVETSESVAGGAVDRPEAAALPPALDSGTGGQIFHDPRRPGLTYFVLVETVVEGAERLARYCRGHGLEAYVVGDDTRRFRKVIALPGFDPSQRSSHEVKVLEAQIHSVGDQWKNHERGATDLRDAYPSLYRG